MRPKFCAGLLLQMRSSSAEGRALKACSMRQSQPSGLEAGIGCRKGASPAEIEAVIAAALERAGFAQDKLGAIATPADKGVEAGIAAVALLYSLPLLFIAKPDLK